MSLVEMRRELAGFLSEGWVAVGGETTGIMSVCIGSPEMSVFQERMAHSLLAEHEVPMQEVNVALAHRRARIRGEWQDLTLLTITMPRAAQQVFVSSLKGCVPA